MDKKLNISFVLPMFNESANINNTISKVKEIASDIACDYEIVIVDDCSTDNSCDIVDKIALSDKSIKFYKLEKNTKFGGAFATGFKKAQKDIIVYMDSDLPVDDADIKESLPFIKNNDIVTGHSKINKGDNLKRKIISGIYNLMVQSLFGLNVKDINSGYKVVRKKVVDDMIFISHSPFIDVELFIHAKKKNYDVYQFPLVFKSRSGGKSHIARFSIIMATFIDMIKVKILSVRKKI